MTFDSRLYFSPISIIYTFEYLGFDAFLAWIGRFPFRQFDFPFDIWQKFCLFFILIQVIVDLNIVIIYVLIFFDFDYYLAKF